MKLVPDFVLGWFGKKPSEFLARASERAKARQQEILAQNGVFASVHTSGSTRQTTKIFHRTAGDLDFSRPEQHRVPLGGTKVPKQPSAFDLDEEPKVAKRPKLDAKTLVMAVSLLVNAGLAGVLYGKSTVAEENADLREKVSALKSENARLSRSVEGKIALAPNQRIVSVEQIESLVSSSSGVLETANALSAKVEELENRLAKYEKKKTTAKDPVPNSGAGTDQAKPNPASAPIVISSKHRQISEAVQSVLSSLPSDVSLRVTKNGETTVVTYFDVFGYSRYFTAELPENVGKLSREGLLAWANAKYSDSLDAVAKRQSSGQ